MNLLFPGSFKPFHDGHFSLIKRYVEELSPEKVYIVISPKDRSGISAESSKDFIKNVFKDSWYNTEIIIKISEEPSPINYCYEIIGNDKRKNKYSMINSSKDKDKRVEQFYKLYKKGGDYYNGKSYAVKTDVETEPIYYSTRHDEFEDSPISSAIVRNDIINDDYKNFKKAYREILNDSYLEADELEDYFEELSINVEQTEDDLEKLERYKI